MTTINHALWGATIGRLVGMPLAGAIAGSAPDLFSIPILTYYHFKGKKKSSEVPCWAFSWYSLLHNWIFAVIIIAALYFINRIYGIFGIAYWWHTVEDAFVHTDYSTKFLLPLWNGKIQKYAASEHIWIQAVDLLAILAANILISLFNLRFN